MPQPRTLATGESPGHCADFVQRSVQLFVRPVVPEDAPVLLELVPETAPAGAVPQSEVGSGEALEVATGGVVPRGADAVQMVEFSEVDENQLRLYKPVAPGAHIQGAGADFRQRRAYRPGGHLDAEVGGYRGCDVAGCDGPRDPLRRDARGGRQAEDAEDEPRVLMPTGSPPAMDEASG